MVVEVNTGETVKTALVTGGSRGIGRGIALALAERGYDLAICHWNDGENAKATKERIERSFGRRCEMFERNLKEEAEPGRLAEEAIRALGRIGVLVNNAGITIFETIDNVNIRHINTLINLDFRAPILLAQAIGKHMTDLGIRGSIVNITSTRAERAYTGDAVYGGVKAALARAAASIALDLSAYGIRVNCVAPGAIKTNAAGAGLVDVSNPAVPLQRSGKPEDVGQAVAWLVSDAASYVTGTTLRVDGGLILPGTPH